MDNEKEMQQATDKPKSLADVLNLPSMKEMAETASKRQESDLRIKAADLAVMVMSLSPEFKDEKTANQLVAEAEIILTFLKGK